MIGREEEEEEDMLEDIEDLGVSDNLNNSEPAERKSVGSLVFVKASLTSTTSTTANSRNREEEEELKVAAFKRREELNKTELPSFEVVARASVNVEVDTAPATAPTTASLEKELEISEEEVGDKSIGILLPGQATIYVKTWGCSHNNSDGEYMAGLLAEQGYTVVLESNLAPSAQVWILNSCTVKNPSQQTFSNDIEKGLATGKKVIVSGCVPQGEKEGEMWKKLSVIGVQQIDKVVYVVEETLKGNIVKLFKESKQIVAAEGDGKEESGKKRKSGGASLNLPKIRRNPYIEIIPVNTGCLNQCTYCKTKHARGDLGSYTIAEIVDRLSSVLDEGVLEVWLTSEDIGAYGIDLGTNIVELLSALLEEIERHPLGGNMMLRVGMTNPPYIKAHIHEIAKILMHPNVYAFLHIPVQAGSSKVLDDMRRLYTIEDFEYVCDVLRESVPGITLATDVICGFPGETEVDFDETIRIMEKYLFPSLHISQFYSRPGTPAARMKKTPSNIVKARSRRATTVFESYTTLDHLVGSIQSILVTEASTDGINYVGHNKFFHQVLVLKDDRIMGRRVDVLITSASKWSLKGEVLLESFKALEDSSIVNHRQQRIPKLVRNQKAIVSLGKKDDDRNTTPFDQRGDGAIYSAGSNPKIDESDSSHKAKASNLSAVDNAILQRRLLLGGAGMLAVSAVIFSPIRLSMKILLVSMIALTSSSISSFYH